MANSSKKQYRVLFGNKDGKTLFQWKGEFEKDITDLASYWDAYKFVKRPQNDTSFKKGKKKIAVKGGGLGLRWEMKEKGVTKARIWEEWDANAAPPATVDGVDKGTQSAEYLAVLAEVDKWKAQKDAEREAEKAKEAAAEPKTITVAASKASPAKAAAPASPAVPDGAAEALRLLADPSILAALRAIGEKVGAKA